MSRLAVADTPAPTTVRGPWSLVRRLSSARGDRLTFWLDKRPGLGRIEEVTADEAAELASDEILV